PLQPQSRFELAIMVTGHAILRLPLPPDFDGRQVSEYPSACFRGMRVPNLKDQLLVHFAVLELGPPLNPHASLHPCPLQVPEADLKALETCIEATDRRLVVSVDLDPLTMCLQQLVRVLHSRYSLGDRLVQQKGRQLALYRLDFC